MAALARGQGSSQLGSSGDQCSTTLRIRAPQQKTPLNPISTTSWLGDPDEGFKCSGLQFLL